jgi:hypothetical protein
MSSETQTVKEVIEGSLSSDDTHAPLLLILLNGKARTVPLELAELVSRVLFGSLTLRDLGRICTACIQKPTAPMLAIALQNSIPSLTGLPMDNPDPAFYIDIAKKYFDPTELTVAERVFYHRRVHWFQDSSHFFPEHVTDLYAPYNYLWPCGLDYYIACQMSSIQSRIYTKKTRDFVRGLMMEWRAFYGAAGNANQLVFIDRFVSILDHGFVLRSRRMMPGCVGQGSSFMTNREHL